MKVQNDVRVTIRVNKDLNLNKLPPHSLAMHSKLHTPNS